MMKHARTGKRVLALRAGIAVLVLAVLMASLPLSAVADTKITLTATEISNDNRQYDWVSSMTETYTYDFTSTEITDYSRDEKIATASLRTGMIFDGSTLSCVEGKTFSFGSAIFLGDDYGIYGGEMSFDAQVTDGLLSVGLRLSRTATDTERRGIWFTFDGTNTVLITEPESGLSATVSADSPASVGKLTFRDKPEVIEVLLGETLLCSVQYDKHTAGLAVWDAAGNAVASVATSSVRPAGYFTLYADGMVGKVDNLSFEHTELTRTDGNNTPGTAIDYTTWVATDDRDRTTSTNVPVRDGKQVGLFYFLCQVGEDSEFIQDNTKIFLDEGLDGLRDHLTDTANSGSYYWAEPYFGYYKNVDTWVFRKHAYQLEAAGVDFIFLDFTNGATYPEGLIALLDTWLEIRKEGGSTPDICVFSGGSYGAVMSSLRGSIFSEAGFAKYGELFYQYEGKPLTLVNNIDGKTGGLETWIRDTFTVRNCWAWTDQNGSWNWLQEYTMRGSKYQYYNGGPGRDFEGNFEQLALCVGHHPTTSKGRSYFNKKFPTILNEDYGFSLDSGAGTGFAFQFDAVMNFDPDMILITGWNEWVAGLNHSSSGFDKFAGVADEGFQFVDQFNTEHSRDAEPMRIREGEAAAGFGDNYYYQMTDYIRRFKGTGAVTEASGQISITLGHTADWDRVGPVYGDHVGDTEWRQADSYFTGLNYVNNSGRNDLVSAKVSQDADYLYFLVNTAENVVIDDGSNWMNLYLDIDNNPATGWEGYDFVLNRARDGHYVSVESLAGGWAGTHVGQALYTVSGNQMVIRLSKAVVGVSGTASEFCFKWADNSTVIGSVMEFMDLGDTAPNDRFSYLYICPESEGNDAVAVAAYTLLSADGREVEARDETAPLPGMGDPSDETNAGDTTDNTMGTQEPTTESEGSTTNNGTASVVYKYSNGLKITIVLTGVVLGGCLYAAIVVPKVVIKKRKK